MIKRIQKKYKTIEEENDFSSYLENYENIHQDINEKGDPLNNETSNQTKPEKYFCHICQISFLKNNDNLKKHINTKVSSK